MMPVPVTYIVSELWDGRRASIKNGIAGNYTRVWQVVTDNEWAGPVGVTKGWQEVTGLKVGDPYWYSIEGYEEDDPYSLIRSITPTQDSVDRYKWTVTVEYTSEWDQASEPTALPPIDPASNVGPNGAGGNGGAGGGGGGGGGGGSSVARPVTIDYDGYEIEVPLERAFPDENYPVEDYPNGPVVANSAGEQFDPPVMVKKYIRVINIVKNKPEFLDLSESSYAGCVNSEAFTIGNVSYAAGTLKIAGMPTGKQHDEGGLTYFAVHYRVEVDLDGWNPIRILDKGWHYWEESGDSIYPISRLRQFTDGAGNSTPKEGLLNGSGYALNGVGKIVEGADEAFFRPFTAYYAIDFADVGMV